MPCLPVVLDKTKVENGDRFICQGVFGASRLLALLPSLHVKQQARSLPLRIGRRDFPVLARAQCKSDSRQLHLPCLNQ